jgi:hypothetical protein
MMCNLAVPTTGRALASLSILWLLGPVVRADPIPETIKYTTSMTLGDTGVTGPPLVAFWGVADHSITTPTPSPPGMTMGPIPAGYQTSVPLGYFTVSRPADQSSTTYDHTPFVLSFRVNSVDGDPSGASPQNLLVPGYLDGTVSSSQPSTLRAQFVVPLPLGTTASFASLGGFRTGPLMNTLTFPLSDLTIPLASGPTNTIPLLSGQLISALETPEPSSVVLFGLLGLGLIARRGRLGRGPGPGAG